MQRRLLLLAGFCCVPARAQAPVVARVALITELAKLLASTGEAITKLTEGIKSLVLTGKAGYDYIAAQKARTALVDISRETARLLVGGNKRAATSLKRYLSLPSSERTELAWSDTVRILSDTLDQVRELLSNVRSVRSDFVLEPTYISLTEALESRSSVLQQLAQLSPPRGSREIAALRKVHREYLTLIAKTKQAVLQLNEYIKRQK